VDYLPKPFTPEQIRHVVDQSLKQRDLKTRLSDMEERLQEATPAIDLETESPRIRSILRWGKFPGSFSINVTPVPIIITQRDPLVPREK
jgi:DNA-binding NtrC family response regulator